MEVPAGSNWSHDGAPIGVTAEQINRVFQRHVGIHRDAGRRTWNVVYLSGDSGSVMLEVCADGCGQMKVHCEHAKNSWNQGGTQLTCDLCGADGT